ncbi:diacylglycerol kinase family protein [Granulicoccus sp. GXG6511]|uniref:diacylglycerol kinase family protein n=1 Tax=Granulicoccus sp. GXG6511 TaxID=3381351 RepID=UPI003D7DCD09
MSTSRPSRFSVWTTVGLAAAFVAWTWSVVAGVFDDFDRGTVARGFAPSSAAAEIWSAIAILTWPGVPYFALLVVGFWAFRRRLRNLAYALWLAIPLGWGSHLAVKAIVRRPRPDAVLELVTGHGWAYPSGHMTTATVVAAMLIASVLVTRQSRFARWLAWGLGAAAVVVVGLCRWVLQAHWFSDLVGGVLLGAFVAATCLVVARVHVLPDNPWELALPRPVTQTGKQCVVIFNPTKVLDVTTFRRHVEYELRNRGWEPPLWLETTRNDPGYRMAALAVKQQADLVLTAGGDGTIRAVCEGLAGSGIPLGLLPAGTGNLLARNLGVPLDESLALRTAFDGEPRPTDLVRLTADPGTDREQSHVFGVMAGIGVDAAIMQHTNPDLKRTVGPAAYVLAAAQNANHPALPVTVRVDGGPPFRRKAAVVLIGNVGVVTGNIELIPGASAMDGLLDVMIASPRTAADWARLTAKVLTRRRGEDDRMDLVQGTRVRIESDRVDAYQVDGDTGGECSVLEAEVLPGVLLVMGARVG